MCSFRRLKRRSKTKKFLSISFPLCGGWWGESQIKMIGNFGVLPRASLSSAAEAQVSLRQNPADFARNTFELRPIHTAGLGARSKTGRPSVYNTFENRDLAVGNIIGSNILNILWVLGLTGIILPLPFNADFEH